MSQEETAKMELPKGWKKINFFSLNLAYCFFVMFVSLQVPTVRKILIKAFTEEHYDMVNGGGLIFLGYLLCIFVGNLSETYTGFMAYIIKDDSIEMTTVAARTFNRSMFLLAKFLLWYYLVKHNFEMFKNKF